jgi:hypothetical protein
MRHMPPRAPLALTLLLSGALACASAPPPIPEIVPEVSQVRPPEPFPKGPAPPAPPPEPAAPEPDPVAAAPAAAPVVEPPPFTPASIAVPGPRPAPDPLPSYGGPEPCRGPAATGDSLVAQACRAGGQQAARTRMKEMLRLVRDHGMDFICSDCHPDPLDYARLNDGAAERFARLAAALPR